MAEAVIGQKEPPTVTVFRTFREYGDVVALFPYLSEGTETQVTDKR